MSPKKQYDMLLEMGDLLETYPHLTGNWNQDKKEFIEIVESEREGYNK